MLSGKAMGTSMTNGATVNNGNKDVPSILLPPVAVTKDNVNATVIKDGFWTAQQVCTAAYADVCKAAGIQ